MTNRLALILFGLILIFLIFDFLTDSGYSLFLAREMAQFVEWVSFWR